MIHGVLLSAAFLLGVFVSLASVVAWKQSRDSTEQGDEVEYDNLFMAIDEAIAVQREDGTVTDSNESFRNLVGTDPEGSDIESVLSTVPELQRRVVEHYEGVAAVETGGGTDYYDVSLHSIEDEATGQLILCHEVTGQQERRRRLEEQNETLERFVSLVSHDLRNPLDVAIGRTTAVAESTDNAELKSHVESTQQALDRMETIISHGLVLARQRDGISETTPTPLDELGERCWQNVETSEATLQIETDEVVEANMEGLSHVLENLFRNAVEHGSTSSQAKPDDAVDHGSTGSDSEVRQNTMEHSSTSAASNARKDVSQNVTVTVGTLPDRCGFYVADDGPGIPESERERLYGPGETGSQCGTGLGLAIVDSIVDAHGWELDVTESSAGGARFEFTGVETRDDVAAQER